MAGNVKMISSSLNSSTMLFRSFRRYVLISVIGFSTNFGLTIFLHEVLGVKPEGAYATALVAVFFLNFAMLRYWVYAHTRGETGVSQQFILMAVSSASFRLLEYGAFFLLHVWFDIYYIISILAVMSVSAFSKFFFYHSVVFARRIGKDREQASETQKSP